jgi:hypothetical protein
VSEPTFRFHHPVVVRFRDIDAGGHAHHSQALVYFEEARSAYWSEVVGKRGLDGVGYQRTFGERRAFPGEVVDLSPGESITLPPRLYHEFWAERASVLIGEVSAVNDDTTDNRFAEPVGRFPEIEEDEPILHYLCNEYPPAG